MIFPNSKQKAQGPVKVIFITIFLSVFLFGVLGCNKNESSWELYSNKEYAISFYYPDTWRIVDSAEIQTFAPLVLIQEPPTAGKQFFANINLMVQSATFLALSAEEQAAKTVDQLSQNGALMGIRNYEKISYEATEKYKQIKGGLLTSEFTMSQNDQRVKQMQLILPSGQKTYLLTLTATPDTWNEYKPVFDDVLKSFKIDT